MQDSVILVTTAQTPGKRSPNRTLSLLYSAALARAGLACALYAGGAPEPLAARFDGLVLSGGGDIDPARYGQTPGSAPLAREPQRDAEEFALLAAFCARGKPVLGICRGIQVLNVFCGGTLAQDVPGHNGAAHPVAAVPGTAVHRLCGARFSANSYHHQTIDRLGGGLRAAAYAQDGCIEAVEHETLPLLGVQWHPERMLPGLCADTPADHTALFGWLDAHERDPHL